mgnify:FL=1
MTPAHERKAKERKAKQSAGLVRVEVWVYPEMKAPLAEFVEARVNMMRIVRDAQSPQVTNP